MARGDGGGPPPTPDAGPQDAGPPLTSTLAGRVTYDFVPAQLTANGATLRFDLAAPRPVRSGLVRVLHRGATLAQTATDEDGRYHLAFSAPDSNGLAVYALAATASPAIQVEDNTSPGEPVWALGASLTGLERTLDLHAAHGGGDAGYGASSSRAAAPFAIVDSMYTAARAITQARPGLVLPALRCNWSPKNTPEVGQVTLGLIGTSYFDSQDKQIYILGKAGADADEFDAHVIVHEWGHFFEDALSRSDSPGGSHASGEELDPRLSMGEGWGDAVASMVLPTHHYVDTSWDGLGALSGFGWDTESEPSPTDDPFPSAFSEASVMRLLFDLYDGNNEPFDQLALGLGPILDVLTGPQRTTEAMTTIGSFIAALRGHPAVVGQSAALDELLSHAGIAPISSPFGEPDARLAAMYARVTVPASASVTLQGPYRSNLLPQNRYLVFQGTGGTVSITATSTSSFRLTAYQSGLIRGSTDNGQGLQASLSLATSTAHQYVVVVTGLEASVGEFTVSLSLR